MARIATSAVQAVARAELRTRWQGILALGLLLGLIGGVGLAAASLAERTGSAYGRLVQAVGLDDARVLLAADRPALAAAVPTLPGVVESWISDAWVAQVDGPELRYTSVGAGVGGPPDLVRPVVVEGREPAVDAADELLLGEPLAAGLGLGVGDEVVLRLLTAEEIGMFDVGFGEPDGATVRMRIVGIGRMPSWGEDGLSNALASPAFAIAHAGTAGARGAHVRLADREPATREAFAAALAAAGAADPTVSVVADYLPLVPAFPTSAADPSVRTAERVLVAGLAVFVGVLVVGGLLIVGQGLGRHHAGRRETQWIESELGLTTTERVAARLLAALPGAAVAALAGGALAVAAGVLEPLGSQARFEPTPGFRPPWPIAVAGGLALGVVFLLLTAVAVAFAGRPVRLRAAVTARPAAPAGGRSPAVALGVRMAWRGRSGAAAVATVLGAALAIGGIVATVTFGAGLQRLVDTPSRYGYAADITLVDAREPDIAALVADGRAAAVDVVTGAMVLLAGDSGPIGAVAYEHRKGAMPVETVSGRAPVTPGEVAVGPRTATRLGLAAGDTVLAQAAGGEVPLVVTGIVVAQPESQSPLGDSVLVVPAQLPGLAVTTPLVSATVLAAPGRADALFAELSARLEVFRAELPDDIRNLADLARLPGILAALLALATTAGLAHVLLTAGRRHTRDVAVLAVLGATPAQMRASLAVMAVATVAPALVVGVPLGLGIGRVLWWHVADATGVAGDVALPWTLLLAIGPVALAGALLVAAVPAVRATRTPPAAALAAG